MNAITQKNWFPAWLSMPMVFIQTGLAIRLGHGDFNATMHWHAGLGILLIACETHSVWPIDSSGKFLNLLDAARYLDRKPKPGAVSDLLSKIWFYSVISAFFLGTFQIVGGAA